MAELIEYQVQLAAMAQGRIAMRTLLMALRDGHIRGKDIRPAIEAVIGTGTDLADSAPEVLAVEDRRRLAADAQVWKDAFYRASRDADAMAMVLSGLGLADGKITNLREITITPELWSEIQDALARSEVRTQVRDAFPEVFTDEGSARSET